jgi:hypothetical protein
MKASTLDNKRLKPARNRAGNGPGPSQFEIRTFRYAIECRLKSGILLKNTGGNRSGRTE